MMGLVLLAPFVSIVVIVLLIFQWNNGDPSWHPYLAAGYVLFGLAALLLVARQVMREDTAIRPSRVMREDCPWLAGTTADRYAAQVAVLLRAHGWRVVSSAAGLRDRVEIIVRKDRWTIALLVLGPEQAGVSAEDLARLQAMRHDAGAGRRAVVSAGNPRAATASLLDPAGPAHLRFEDLPRLEDALGLWS